MIEKLKKMKIRFDELNEKLADPQIIARQDEWQKVAKEHAALSEIMVNYDAYLRAEKDEADCERMLKEEKDPDLLALVEEERQEAKEKMEKLKETLKIQLLPKDPNDDKNVVIEIRAGTGGEEASLFGAVLMRMYMRFAERMRWKTEEVDINMTDLGGVKEAVFLVSGKGAYSKLKYESGAHRVQRVPATESQGRIHTSAATVAVLPEAEDVDASFNPADLKIDTYRAGGAGGQYVNKTESAIRITHIPTGLVVTCQDEKSQIKNKEKAMKVLKSKLYDYYRSQADKEYAEKRKAQVGSGDRSERIRTYNYPQGRVTDHRIGMTLYSLEQFLDGDMLEMIEALALNEQNELLKNSDRS
ncbi:MAG: peptide chain release factor 1 [Clostridia bacterium]|nr:peptide chain release factor 1 [Clostridia bacterium]